MSTHELANHIQQLLHQRDQHVHAIVQIDYTLNGVVSLLSGDPTTPANNVKVKQAGLTPRERQTLRHLLSGRSERGIAKVMRLST